MQTNTNALMLELRRSLNEITEQEENLKKIIRSQYPVHLDPADINYLECRDRAGRPMLLDVTLAKANLLTAMANLQASTAKR